MNIKKVCRHCGSDQLLVDADARWSVSKQRYEFAGNLDYHNCEACGACGGDIVIDMPLDIELSAHAKPCILVSVSGGNVQGVYCTPDLQGIECTVVDADNDPHADIEAAITECGCTGHLA